MNFKQLFRSDDRAVSPVLGVALLIAITVILAGVVAFVVLGVDSNNASAPQASLDFEQVEGVPGSDPDVIMRHTGGAPLPAENTFYQYDVAGTDTTTAIGKDLRTGLSDDVLVDIAPGTEISVVWEDPNSDREVLLGTYTVE